MMSIISAIAAAVLLVWFFRWRKNTYGPVGSAKGYAEYERRALSGDEEAQYELATAYYTEQDASRYPQIFRWALFLAEKGNDPAMMLLTADLYSSGAGTGVNLPEALHWYERALSQDIVLGQETNLPKEAHDYLEERVQTLRRELYPPAN